MLPVLPLLRVVLIRPVTICELVLLFNFVTPNCRDLPLLDVRLMVQSAEEEGVHIFSPLIVQFVSSTIEDEGREGERY